MNSTKISKNIKKKLTPNFTMGQKIATSPASTPSKCSIFRVDEDVKFVVENSDESESSPPVPALQNIKQSRKTYSKRNPVSPGISLVNKGPFEFSLVPKAKSFTFDALNCTSNRKDSLPLKQDPEITCHQPSRKVQKKEIPEKCKTAYKIGSKDINLKRKATFPENETSSDSDIEVLEVKVVNPDGLKFKPINMLNNRKKLKLSYNDLMKKNEEKPVSQHVSTSCFMAGNELVVNEADPAPHLPANPNGQGVSSSMKWLRATIDSVNVSHYGNHNVSKHSDMSSKSSESKVLPLPEVKRQPIEKSARSRELKNLYENLDEISWTQESSFKKLLRNPDYLRHSERNTARTAKTLRQQALKNSTKTAIFKKPSVVKSSLKKCKLPELSRNKKLTNLNKIKTANQVSKVRTKPSCNKLPSKNSVSKVEIKRDSNEDCKPVSIIENLKQKNPKKQILNSNRKAKVISNAKTSFNKAKNGKSKLTVPVKKAQIKMKREDSEASSSGSQSFVYDTSVYHQNNQNEGFETLVEENAESNSFKIIKKYKKDTRVYTAVRQGSKCQVRVQPLEHTNLWNNECYETYKKQFLRQAFRKAVENKESNSIATMLQELCDSYATPSVLKKKKAAEEVLRSSARQSEVACRYKEIVVKKYTNYMQFILVPNSAKKNCLSIDAIKELRAAFLLAKKDQNCRAVLISSSGPYFCNGIDLGQLVGANKKQACEEMATVIKDLVMVLGQFPKPVVAAVNGSALGLGVSILTYCDIVFASDKATFCIPANMIGYIPEGGVTMTLPQVVGSVWASEMLLQGISITAEQAFQKGLVSEVVWPNRLMNIVFPRMQALAAQPLQVMEATKLLLRANFWDKLKNHLELERRLLASNLFSAECQANMKQLSKKEYMSD